MSLQKGEWELEYFMRVHYADEVEVLIERDGYRALIVWPWYIQPEALQPAMKFAKDMGYTQLTETGNMVGYSIPESDAIDWDFMLMEDSDA